MFQNTDNETKLAEAKDRAQLTATTAMSVVHVALLRSLIGGGPAANRYYYIVLVLILMSLVLQILAGLIALALSHMKSYYTKHQEDCCSQLCSNLFSCHLGCDMREEARRDDKYVVQTESGGADDGGGGGGVDNRGFNLTLTTARRGEVTPTPDAPLTGCCPLMMTSVSVNVMPEEDVRLEARSNRLMADMMESDLLVAAANVEIEHQEKLRDETRRKRGELMASKPTEAYATELKDFDNSLAACEMEISRYQRTKRRNDVLHEQSDILSELAGDATKRRILKKLSFWQHDLNYILYFVFIFNTFIAGLGVTPTVSNGVANVTK